MLPYQKPYNFDEKWEAQAFVLVCHLNKLGYFSWSEWTQALSKCLRVKHAGEVNYGSRQYYIAWISAVETLLIEKGLITSVELANKTRDCRLSETVAHHRRQSWQA